MQHETSESAPPGSRPGRVIIADDHELARLGLRTMLEPEPDLEVVGEAATGREAVELSRRLEPDLVLMDIRMPDVDGLVLCADLKARMDVPIIVCSGTNRKRDGTLALRLGADDFVSKPFDMYDLEARVEAVLRRSSRNKAERPISEPDHYQVGDLVISRSRRHVTLGGRELQVTPTEYRLICSLASRPDDPA